MRKVGMSSTTWIACCTSARPNSELNAARYRRNAPLISPPTVGPRGSSGTVQCQTGPGGAPAGGNDGGDGGAGENGGGAGGAGGGGAWAPGAGDASWPGSVWSPARSISSPLMYVL